VLHHRNTKCHLSFVSAWLWGYRPFQLARSRLPTLRHVSACFHCFILLWIRANIRIFLRLSNDKPSAIFRIRGTSDGSNQRAADIVSGAEATATLGISIESLEEVQAQVASLPSQSNALVPGRQQQLSNPVILAERIVKHLFSYVSSFAMSGTSLRLDSVVQLATIRRWYESFQSKLKTGGVAFLDKEDL
jgi:hypothetical protein